MSLAKITKVTGQGVHVPGDDIDTDRIIPARFMKCITFDGLGDYLFYDVRKDADGNDKDHNLNDPKFANATIMISGDNFGCGSSREHAPQALYRAGYRAVIASSFAEIFFGNSIQLGMPCVSLSTENIEALEVLVNNNPETEITIDIDRKLVLAGPDQYPLEIREGARSALMNGKWDPLLDLLEGEEMVNEVASRLSYVDSK